MYERVSILIVDDDEADRLTIRGVLRHSPIDAVVRTAANIAEAMALLADAEFGWVVIVDYRLGGEDGLELLRSVRRGERTSAESGGIPIIVLTGRGDELVAVEAMKAGATDYIPKSELTTDRLTSAIRTGIEIHRQRGEAAAAHAALQRAHSELERRVAQRTDELRRANDELIRRNAELDEFTYVASHDLQEPLRKLVAFSELLPRDLGHELPTAAEHDLRYITEAARRMRSLVQALLELSRAGKDAMKRERVALDDCVDRACKALASRIEETGARIASDELPTIVGDSMMLTQLYQNLIGNALKFVEPGRRPNVRLTAERTEDHWVLGVRDDGIGIKPEYAAQIFAPFKRLHGRDEYEGAGIGLSICRKTVERHGGRIWVESEPKRGAHFKFALSAALEAEPCMTEAGARQSCC